MQTVLGPQQIFISNMRLFEENRFNNTGLYIVPQPDVWGR